MRENPAKPAAIAPRTWGGVIDWLDRKVYSPTAGGWDNALFRGIILDNLEPSHVLLDVGAGAGLQRHMDFTAHAKLVCGIDPDPRVSSNRMLHVASVSRAERIPWPDNTFDIVISNNVLEHLSNPGPVFGEIRRVLKPNGLFLFKTPNRWHYVTLAARLTPHRFHEWFNSKRGRATKDTFRTYYRANSSRTIRRYCRANGLTVRSIQFHEDRPEYLRLSVPTYLAGFAYERLVNRLSCLEMFRVVIIGIVRKVGF